MKPEFSKPFDLAAARAGAPFACTNGLPVKIHNWKVRGDDSLIFGEITALNCDVLAKWNVTGACLSAQMPLDLVMLPLGLIDGKPVFVGDELVYDNPTSKDYGPFIAGPNHRQVQFNHARWPAPAKVYPETTLSPDHLRAAYDSDLGGSVDAAVRRVANAALRHAIDAGQMVVVDWDAPVRAARDMAIGEAVRNECLRISASFNHGGMSTVEAFFKCRGRTSDMNLADTIATVK